MTYAEAVARLLALRGGEHAGMRPGLERIEGLLGALGNPERRSGWPRAPRRPSIRSRPGRMPACSPPRRASSRATAWA